MNRKDDSLDCRQALLWIEPSLDGELMPAVDALLRRHLEACPSCAAERALAGEIQRGLRALPLPDCPPEVLERVRRAGAQAGAHAGSRILPFPARRLRAALAAAVLALAVGGGAAFLVERREDRARSEELARATAEARFALAYVGRVSRRTGLELRDGMRQHMSLPEAHEAALQAE
jgi:anti-sigma factor RsiW